MEQIYRDVVQKKEAELCAWNKKSNIMGSVKLVLFFACAVIFIMLWLDPFSIVRGAAACSSLLLFFISFHIHERILRRIDVIRGLCGVAANDVKRISGTWSTFPDTGEEYADSGHAYATDLDIVGERSLFQFINRTNTYHGRKSLAKALLHSEYSVEQIRKRQKAVEELREDYEWAAYLEYLFSTIGVDDNFPQMLSEVQNEERFITFQFANPLTWLLRIVTCAAALSALFLKSNRCFFILGMLLLLQLSLGGIGTYRIKKYLRYTKTIAGRMAPYNLILQEIASRKFSSVLLTDIQSCLSEAMEGIRQLTSISSHMKYMANPIAGFLLNAVLLWDYKNAFDFQKWKQRYGGKAKEWFTAAGEFESFLSFAGLARTCDTVCLPVISEKDTKISAVQIGHPLLANRERVCNDFEMPHSIIIISGSNMSGKSTFMRTAGINLVLARAGSYVCAEYMCCPVLRIVTSMRIADRTTEGISTFYSELLRIRKMIDCAAEYKNVLFLIDEIFRGTNSVDRQKGAEGVLKRLHELGACGMITTHDLEICNLADETEIINYSFYEEYEGDEMYFDYQIKKGVLKTRNAEFLLKKIGIL